MSDGGVATTRRMATKARMMPRLISIAVSELSTLLSIATPSSVKANGGVFEITTPPFLQGHNL